ncbi:hypothetical protein GCM10009862_28220 [Microbacterium binotii]|uniref:Uncharacterized protein n=1 Tax=Microbacterium binotii TaxID=462710 RepID=A0ABN3PIR6_9MICO
MLAQLCERDGLRTLVDDSHGQCDQARDGQSPASTAVHRVLRTSETEDTPWRGRVYVAAGGRGYQPGSSNGVGMEG